jgi:hypothetical protein
MAGDKTARKPIPLLRPATKVPINEEQTPNLKLSRTADAASKNAVLGRQAFILRGKVLIVQSRYLGQFKPDLQRS